MIRLYLLGFVLLFSFALVAQKDSNQIQFKKAFFRNNINAGIPIGIGGGRPFGFSHVQTLKLERVSLSGFSRDKERSNSYSDGAFDFTVDLFEVKRMNAVNRAYLTASLGDALYNRPLESSEKPGTNGYVFLPRRKRSISLDSTHFDRKRYLISRYFNWGVNFGLGGGRIGYFLPAGQLKTGPFTFKGGIYGSKLNRSKAGQVQLDLFPIMKQAFGNTAQINLSINAGYSLFNMPFTNYTIRNEVAMVGLSCIKLNSHIEYGAKLGFSNFKCNECNGGDYRTIIPFGEIYLAFSTFRHLKKPIFYGSNNEPVVYRESITKKTRDSIPSEFPILSRYFNPRLSLGVGSTHPSFIFPTIGFKAGRFDAGFGFGADFNGDITASANADIDIYRLKKDSFKYLTVGTSAGLIGEWGYASLNVGVRKYFKRSSFSWKGGLGILERAVPFPFPMADFSYQLYLFKF